MVSSILTEANVSKVLSLMIMKKDVCDVLPCLEKNGIANIRRL